ncbi:hypothetical protein JK636_00250 [Clostridium sp. YIM B02515]|uniref:Glycosyl transferase n=1 Tax=Clostridium rhizosphaerae TaxID=2803861 RepID=A0ABS1T4L0_9CLOT|nr:hypothetical protein [Clostridium rhizosphaerae]MBL4934181.1 hypothetical protein [Clostridium rhizosphaerae]
MRKQVKYFLIGLFIILISTPLGYKAVSIVYFNRNLTGEYVPILNGFIHSFMLIGTLIFSLGLVNLLKDKN